MGTMPAGNSAVTRTTYSQLANGAEIRERIQGLEMKTADRVDAYLSGEKHPAVRWTDIRTVVEKADLVVYPQTEVATRYLLPDDCAWSEYREKGDPLEVSPKTLRSRRQVYPDRVVVPLSRHEVTEELQTIVEEGRLGFELAEVAMPRIETTPEYLSPRDVIGVDQAGDLHVWDGVVDAVYTLSHDGKYSWVANGVEPDRVFEDPDDDVKTISDWIEFIEEEWGWKMETVRREAHRDVIREVQSE